MPFIAPIVIGIGAAVGGAVAAVGTFVAASGVIGSAIIGAGLSVGIGYLQQALQGTPDVPGNTSSVSAGVNFERQYGENIPRNVACGTVGLAGHDVYVNTYSNSNNELQQLYVLSDYYSTGLRRVGIGGTWQTLGDAVDPIKGRPITSGEFANLIWIKFLDGRQTVADPGLVAHANPSDRWTAACVGLGETAIIVSMTYDQDKNNSFPDFFFEFDGAPLYDWRKDSTAGGDGSHRWNDVTTHEFSDNPILIEYNYRRGFSVNDDMFCGMGMPAGDLPIDKFSNAANICDERVNGEARYRCSIFLDCMTQHGDNLKSIALSCGALQVDGVDGSWPIVGSDQPSVITFTDDDIVWTDEFKFRKKRSMGDLINSVAGNFPDPTQQWSMIGYETQTSSDLVTLDRRSRDVGIDFPQVPYPRQAAQLAWIYLYENRYEATATLTLRPRFQTIETGDWVRWNSARYGDMTFIVNAASLVSLDADTPRNVKLQLQERNGQIYDGITPPVIVLPTPPGQPVYSTEVDSFGVIAVSVVGDSGRAQAALRASWATVLDTTVTGVELRWWPTANPTTVMTKTVRPDVTVNYLTEGVVGNTFYTVQARILTTPQRVTVFNAGENVKTVDLGSVGINDIDAEIFATLGALEGSLRDQISTINTQINQLRMNQVANGYVNRRVVRQDLVSVTDTAFAQIVDVRTVATDTQSALAEFETTATAAIGDNTAQISVIGTVVADLEGWATASYSVKLDVNDYWAGMQLYNGGPATSGAIFTVDNFQIAIPGVGGTATPIFTTGLVNGVPKTGIRGDAVIDGSLTARSFSVISLSSVSANLGAITAGTITGLSGKMFIDVNNARQLFSD